MLNFSSLALTVAMFSAVLLIIGGAKLAINRQTRVRGVLMVVAAAVIVMNVMILTV